LYIERAIFFLILLVAFSSLCRVECGRMKARKPRTLVSAGALGVAHVTRRWLTPPVRGFVARAGRWAQMSH